METRIPYQHPFHKHPVVIRYERDTRSLTTKILDDTTAIYNINKNKQSKPMVKPADEVTASMVVPREAATKTALKSLKIEESYKCRDANCNETFNMVFKLIIHENQAHNLRIGAKGLKKTH